MSTPLSNIPKVSKTNLYYDWKFDSLDQSKKVPAKTLEQYFQDTTPKKSEILLPAMFNGRNNVARELDMIREQAACQGIEELLMFMADVNDFMREHNFIAAEHLLGRRLTVEEIEAQFVSDKRKPIRREMMASAQQLLTQHNFSGAEYVLERPLTASERSTLKLDPTPEEKLLAETEKSRAGIESLAADQTNKKIQKALGHLIQASKASATHEQKIRAGIEALVADPTNKQIKNIAQDIFFDSTRADILSGIKVLVADKTNTEIRDLVKAQGESKTTQDILDLLRSIAPHLSAAAGPSSVGSRPPSPSSSPQTAFNLSDDDDDDVASIASTALAPTVASAATSSKRNPDLIAGHGDLKQLNLSDLKQLISKYKTEWPELISTNGALSATTPTGRPKKGGIAATDVKTASRAIQLLNAAKKAAQAIAAKEALDASNPYNKLVDPADPNVGLPLGQRGTGTAYYKARLTQVGRGISDHEPNKPDEPVKAKKGPRVHPEDWSAFGPRFLINHKKLGEGAFSTKLPSGCKVLKNTDVSRALQACLQAYHKGEPANTADLTSAEQEWLKYVLRECKLIRSTDAPKRYSDPGPTTIRGLRDRAKVLLGMISAGNDSDVLKDELKTITDKLDDRGYISKADLKKYRELLD